MQQFQVNDIETIATGIPGAEGIAIANDGRIFIGAEDGWVYLIDPAGEVSQYVKLPGRPLGIAIDRQENLYIHRHLTQGNADLRARWKGLLYRAIWQMRIVCRWSLPSQRACHAPGRVRVICDPKPAR